MPSYLTGREMGVFVCTFLIGAGILFFAAGVWIQWSERRFVRTAVPVSIEITGLVENRDADGNTFSPVFRINEGDFVGRTRKSSYGSSTPIHSLGERSSGFFNPETGRIESLKSSRAGRTFGVLFMIFGLIFTGLSLYSLDTELSKLSAPLSR